MDTVVDPRMPAPALTPIQSPALTPIRAPTRRMIVKTVVSPEAQAEISAAERAAIEGALTLIGYPAPILEAPDAESTRAIANVQTIIKRPTTAAAKLKLRVQELPTDPMRPVPPLPTDATIRPGLDVAPITLPDGNNVAPAAPPPGFDLLGATVPPGRNFAPAAPPVGFDALGATVPPGHNVALASIATVATLPPSNKVEPARPPPNKVKPSAESAALVVLPKAPASATAAPAAKKKPGRGPRRALIALLAVVLAGVGVAIGALIKQQVTRPAQSVIIEVPR